MRSETCYKTTSDHRRVTFTIPKFSSLERQEKVIYFQEDNRVLFIRSEALMKTCTVPAFDKSHVEKIYNKATSLCLIK